tara:strand:- start:1850 stop:2308 length:459 start_codon:yes stop_codon:yes gene_type:complete
LTFPRNHYELLGVSSLADGDTLRKAFRKLSKELHPDTTSLPKDEAANRFQQICEAYELLTDPILREAYDISLSKMISGRDKFKPESEFITRNAYIKESVGDYRRPLSGGELFSLLLLLIALLISLLLGVGFAMAQGRELMIRPTWLVVLLPL